MHETVSSIQVRAASQDAVIAALGGALADERLKQYQLIRGEELANTLGAEAALGGIEGQKEFLISGPASGWVAILGDGDRRLAAALSQRLAMPTFWVHCDDGLVLRVVYHEGGGVVDGYSSCPAFHEDAILTAGGEAAGGQGAILGAALAADPNTVADLPEETTPAPDEDAETNDEDHALTESGVDEPTTAPTPAGPPDRGPADKGIAERIDAVLGRIRVADIDEVGESDDTDAYAGLVELADIMGWPCATDAFEELLAGGLLDGPGAGAAALVRYRPLRTDERIRRRLGL